MLLSSCPRQCGPYHKPFIHNHIQGCEKLSEMIRTDERTYSTPLRQREEVLDQEDRQGPAILDGRERVMARQTRIRIETESLLVLKGRSSLRGWCPRCQAEGELIPIESVRVISNLAPAEVEAWIESEELHHSRATDDSLLICLNSLLKRVQRTTTA